MTPRHPLPRRLLSSALSAALTLSSWGPAVFCAAAQQIAGRAAPMAVAGLSAPPSTLAPPLASPGFSNPVLVPVLAPPLAVAPSLLAAGAVAPVPALRPASARVVSRLAAAAETPSALAAVNSAAASAETYGRAGAEDFARRATAEELSSAAAAAAAAAAPVAYAPGAALSLRLSAASAGDAPREREPAPPTRPEGQRRAAFFPLWLAAASGAVWGGLELTRWGQSGPVAIVAVAAMVATGAFVVNAFMDAGVFLAAMWRGRGAGEAELRAFLRTEVLEGRIDGNAAAIVRPYRASSRYGDFTFAFVSRGLIWVRPELTATPWLMRQVLLHELQHMKASAPRGPPVGGVRGALLAFAFEIRARAAELTGPRGLKRIKLPALQRALTQTQTSLRLSRPFDILVLNPDAKELEDEAVYDGLSNGAARVTSVKSETPQAELAKTKRAYRAVVLGGAASSLPKPKTEDAVRLDSVLKQLDTLQELATKLVARGEAFAGSVEAGQWGDLVDRARSLRENGTRRAQQTFDSEVRKLWRQIASQRLKGVGVSELIDGLYGSLRDRGTAFLSFGPDEKGIVPWEKLLRYWQAEDGGEMRVTRVDLENGGHVLILRKVEARVGLWLRPTRGGSIATSVENASFSEEGRATARKSLEEAGFGGQLELFDKNDVLVRHVFGADRGRQEIYITVPRGNVSAIRKYVSSHAKVLSSQSNFQTHLMDSAELQEVPPVWQLGITGAAGSIFWIDTGGDATHEDFGGRLDVVDMVDEGPEDWIGHGTHVAGISLSGTPGFLGMAKAAVGVMAKVFSRDQAGASDGDIMAAASIAMKKGSDVISLSLGSRGSSADNLAEFFSELTLHKNAAGEYPIITASAGNSGPFDRTLSQPAAGVRVIAVAAAAKSKDDGQPEIAFYSSVGPDIDRRYAIKRYRFKPELTGIGGDVVTKLFSAIVYLFGVFSTRSKDAPRAPSDMENGKHTGMSGTSMSNPAVAAIAELVKLAMRKCGAITPFVAENMPFAMKAVLMRTARDMGVPVWFQGAGLVSAKAAVSLVAQSGTRALGTGLNRAWNWLTGSTPIATEASWAWLERLKAVEDAEDRAYRVVELTKNEAQARQEAEDPGDSEEPGENPSPEEEAPADSEEPAEQPSQNPDAEAKRQRRFNDARNAEAPLLISALKDEVWLVRLRAAVALMNLKAPAAVEALAEAGLHDPDARVRQMAFLALAEIPTHAVDSLLQRAAAVESWDVGAYAAYALIRRGDRSMIGRIVKELGNRDKRARFTATWLLGQIGGYASAVEAEGLSARVRDRDERGNIRHLAAAALSNLADAAPETLSDPVVANLLDAAGAENLALTRTINKIFPVAVRSKAFVARLRSAPLKPIVTDFVIKNRDAIGKPGALSELVQLLARAAGVPLDAPTAPMDPTGKGVVGVDETMGPVDLLIVPPSRAPQAFRDESDPEGLSRALSDAGLDPALLSRFESAGRAALPLSRAFVLSVPEHKLYALTIVLEHRGWLVRRSLAYYSLSRGPAEAGGTIVNLGDGAQRPVIAADADVSLVRLRASAGVSEARVMSALERVAQVGRGRGPSVVALSLAAPTTRRTLLSTLVDRLVAAGVGVVAGSGNGGPRKGTVSAPGDSALAVIVAAASRAGLQFYSSRGTPEAPRVTWADLVDDLQPADPLAAAQAAGTSVAAERSAAKLADLARTCAEAFAAQGRALPDGWFPYIVELVKSSLTAMPSHGAHEVGGGLFDAPQRAQELLRERLIDPDAVERDARALAEKARGHVAPKAAPR